MQVPILNGIYTDGAPEFRTSYPLNYVPVPKEEGISHGYLKPADGIVQFGTGPGVDRGAINWNGLCYRVLGTKLCVVGPTGLTAVIGDIGGTGQCTLTYSFERLAIASNGLLWYWDGLTLVQVTDPDLGLVLDVVWIAGFFITTDGVNIVQTELGDPTSVNPFKYGSSESNPDNIMRVLSYNNELYAVNRYTTEVFNDVGGEFFVFARVVTAQMNKGALGTHAACVFDTTIAILGGGFNESPAVWVGMNGQVEKISTAEIDTILQGYTEDQLSRTILEARIDKGHKHLLVHLPDQTLVFDAAASKELGEFVWFPLKSNVVGSGTYRARNLVWLYGKWLCGDPTQAKHGYLDERISTHYGDVTAWEFSTTIVYNESRGAIIYEVELICLPGAALLGANPVVWTSYSYDGQTWSQERSVSAGRQGHRAKRLVWQPQGMMRQGRIQKFRGTSDAHIPAVRLEMKIKPLKV